MNDLDIDLSGYDIPAIAEQVRARVQDFCVTDQEISEVEKKVMQLGEYPKPVAYLVICELFRQGSLKIGKTIWEKQIGTASLVSPQNK